ncbi:MAG: type II toxin-antitoxin system HicB family antitoxin [Candidatus Margulisiibacteriota bacterium]
MKEHYYKVIVEPQEEGGFTGFVPKLPGCVTEGETYEETISNLREAVLLYLETLHDRQGKYIVDDTHIAEISIRL